MAEINHFKVVASLPSTLEPDSIYYVRVGQGYDQYVTNGVGVVVAYEANSKLDLENKVDKEEGKQLSDENYTLDEKNKLASLENYDDSAIQTELDTKVDKIAGKQLSDENYTLVEKNKLSGIQAGATKNATDAQLRDRVTHTGVQPIASVEGLQDTLDDKVDNTDSRLTNAREWTASVVSQAEAEAGSSATTRKWTAQRVRQAILGWWNTSTFKTKLDGIEAGATKNATDAQLRSRATHTGVQPISSVTNLQSSLDSKVDKQSGYGLSQENYTTAEKSKLASLEGSKFKGEYTSLAALQAAQPSPEVGSYAYVDAGVGEVVSKYIWDSSDAVWAKQQGETASLTPAEIKSLYEENPDTNAFTDSEKSKLSGIQSGATANATNAQLRDRATHTGVQPISSVSGLQAGLDSKADTTYVNTQLDGKVDKTVSVVAGTGLSGGGTLSTNRTLNVQYGTTAGTAAQGNDSRLSNSREWTATTVSQAEAEAGTATTRRAWTAQRVRQSILAWWTGSADKAKLDGIAAGAQVNVATNLGSSGTGATRTITSSTGSNTSITYSAADVGAVPTARTITAGTGLSGGGNLTANRTLSVDSTVVRTTGNQTIGGIKTLTDVTRFGNGVLGTADDGVGIQTTFTGTAGEDNVHLHLQGVSANDSSDGNFNGGAFIRFATSTSANYGATIGGRRRASGGSHFVVKTGVQNPPDSMVIDENGNIIASRGNFQGNGSGLTNLNANNISSGTISTARLPAAALIGNTTYSAGSGLSLSGTTFNVSYGTTAGTAAQGNDSRLSNSREWTASVVSQTEAQAGTATTARKWTAQRVAQAINALGLKIGTTSSTAKAGNWMPTWSEVSSKPATATRWPSWSEVSSKPSTFAPSSHSHTAADLPNASTSARGVVQLNNSTTSTSTVQAATANAVKTANDAATSANSNANSRVAKSGDTMTNKLTIDNSAYRSHLDLKRGSDIAQINPSTGNNSGASPELRFEGDMAGYWFDGKVKAEDGFSGDGSGLTGTAPSLRAQATTAADVGAPPTSRTITAGAGLSGGGSLAGNRTISLGTPSTITGSTSNSATGSSHTHAINLNASDVGAVNSFGGNWDVYDCSAGDKDSGTDHVLILCPVSGNHNVLGSLWMERTSGHHGATKVDILYSSSTGTARSAQLSVLQNGHNEGTFSLVEVTVGGTDFVALRRTGTRYFLSSAFFSGHTTYDGVNARTWYATGNVTLNSTVGLTGGYVVYGGSIEGNGSGLTNLNANNISSGTISTSRLPAAALIGNTTYSAGTGLSLSGTTFNVNYGTSSTTAAAGNDSRLSNSREWTATTVSQAEAQAGTATTRRAWTSQRVRQNVASYTDAFNSSGTYSGLRAQATTAADVGAPPTGRTITAGDGLSGGGNLTANRTISVDGTVVRTSGNQSIAGNKEFSTGFFGGIATSYGNLSSLVSGGTSAGDMVTGLRIVNRGTSAGTKARVLYTLTTNAAWENVSLEADRYSGSNMRFNIGIGDGANPPTNIAQFYSDRAEINGNLILGEQGTTTAQAVRADRTITAGTGLSGGGNLTANRTLSVKYGTTAGTAAQGNDSRLSNSREWTASVVSQTEAQAGTSTTARKWTAQRVRQAVVAGLNASEASKMYTSPLIPITTSGVVTVTHNLGGPVEVYIDLVCQSADLGYSVGAVYPWGAGGEFHGGGVSSGIGWDASDPNVLSGRFASGARNFAILRFNSGAPDYITASRWRVRVRVRRVS